MVNKQKWIISLWHLHFIVTPAASKSLRRPLNVDYWNPLKTTFLRSLRFCHWGNNTFFRLPAHRCDDLIFLNVWDGNCLPRCESRSAKVLGHMCLPAQRLTCHQRQHTSLLRDPWQTKACYLSSACRAWPQPMKAEETKLASLNVRDSK